MRVRDRDTGGTNRNRQRRRWVSFIMRRLPADFWGKMAKWAVVEDGDGGEGRDACDAGHTPRAKSALLSGSGASEDVANIHACEWV